MAYMGLQRMLGIAALLATSGAFVQSGSVTIYIGNGCFFARQHLMVEKFERSVLNRPASEITSIAGYAGSKRSGPNGSLCYHNSQNISDYGVLGHAEVVKVDVPQGSLVQAFSTYFDSFVKLSHGVWDRSDYYDVGAQYRSLVGFPGGLDNTQVVAALRLANVHNMTLQLGHGADPDTLGTNGIFIMDSDEFPFTQAEVCLQFHDDSPAVSPPYPDSYHILRNASKAHGRLVQTGCPPNFICNSTVSVAQHASSAKQRSAPPAWHGLGKGRTCPAWPKSAASCPQNNVSDPNHEFEPVCVLHFPQIGGELAEQQLRRCMPGNKAPYYQDSQGVFRCACCGAPLWMPHQQFDELPATQWPWPSFHSPPVNGTDGMPNVCHRGPPAPGVVDQNSTIDLGLGAKGEVGCARCGAHLGDYFDTADLGLDHYCINGVCMTPPGGNPGQTCQPTVSIMSDAISV